MEGVIDVHCASLTSQGVQHRVFYLDGHPSRYQPHPTGLNFGEQTGTGVFPVVIAVLSFSHYEQVCFSLSFCEPKKPLFSLTDLQILSSAEQNSCWFSFWPCQCYPNSSSVYPVKAFYHQPNQFSTAPWSLEASFTLEMCHCFLNLQWNMHILSTRE